MTEAVDPVPNEQDASGPETASPVTRRLALARIHRPEPVSRFWDRQ